MTQFDLVDRGQSNRQIPSIRPMIWGDMPDLVKEFDRTWKVKEDKEGRISQLSAEHFVLDYLTQTTRARIACVGGRFMGVTLLREGRGPLSFPKAQACLDSVDATLHSTPLGRKTLASARHWQATEVCLEEETGLATPPQAELKLFLVSDKARGHGIGRLLWQDTLNHLDREGIADFYLHTDSSCDVGYYDHQGMTCLAELRGEDYAAFSQQAGVDSRIGCQGGDATFFEGIDDIFVYGGRVREQLERSRRS